MGGVTTSFDLSVHLGAAPLSSAAIAALDDLMVDVLRDWNEELIQTWPVLTGLSLRGWQSVYSWPRWELFNAVDYSEWVHAKGGDTGDAHQHLWQTATTLLASYLPAMRKIVAENPPATSPTLGFGRPGKLGLSRGPSLGLRRTVAAASEVNIVRGIADEARRRERGRLRNERARPRRR